MGQNMDALGLAWDSLQRARDAVEGVPDLKTKLRERYGDYSSVLENLKSKPDVIAANGGDRELRRLTGLFTRVADLLGEYTAAPGDSKAKKTNIIAKRAAYHEKVSGELQEIDTDVMRQLTIMNLMGVVSSSEMDILKGVNKKIDHLTSIFDEIRPLRLPAMAAVPVGPLKLPPSYINRADVQQAMGDLVDPEKALTPYSVVGMGGAGKTVLVSAIVNEPSIREHYRGGIYWRRVGREQKDNLLPLLQGLAREMGAAPTETPRGMPRVLDSLENIRQHLAAVAPTNTPPNILVVLDDVWEREVVDEFLPLGLKVLVTTRDRSVVGVSGEILELGEMEKDEALNLLLKSSMTVGKPGGDVRTLMHKVVGARCKFLLRGFVLFLLVYDFSLHVDSSYLFALKVQERRWHGDPRCWSCRVGVNVLSDDIA